MSATQEQKPSTRNAVSLRLPPDITEAVDAYAQGNNMRKTDAYIHFLQLGLNASDDLAEATEMHQIRTQLGEVLAILKGGAGA